MACEDAEPSNSEGEIQTQTKALMLSLKRPPVTQLVLGLVVGLGLGLGLRPSTNESSVDRARRVKAKTAGHEDIPRFWSGGDGARNLSGPTDRHAWRIPAS